MLNNTDTIVLPLVLPHSYLRTKHSFTVSTLYCFLLETMHISITEIGNVRSDRFPSVELCKYYQILLSDCQVFLLFVDIGYFRDCGRGS